MEEDLLRHCIELACTNGRKFQSQETGFVSLPISANSSELAMPIYENMLFCLALFRSKMHEAVFEAKKLLDRLLFFQQSFAGVESVGNFPLFIHEFPFCRDHLQAVRCLNVLLWIFEGFHHILGQELLSRLTHALHQLVVFCLRTVAPMSLPIWARLKTACTIAAAADLLEQPSWLNQIELPDLTDHSELRSWGDPIHLGEMISAYQLGSSIVAPEQWKSFWDYLSITWHKESLSYVGPAYKLRNNGATFYDYCMGLFSGKLSQKSNLPQPGALVCALLHNDSALPLQELPFEKTGESKSLSWGLYHEPSYAISYMTGSCRREEMPGFYPFYIASGLHSLAIQSPSGFLSTFSGDSSKQSLVFDIPAEVFEDDKEKNYPLYIWFDDHKKTDILVAGHRSSCFEIKDSLEITLGQCQISLSFEVISGDGQFVGHISRGCRFGLNFKAKEKTVAPDIQISLRAIRGSCPCQLKIELNLLEN